MQGTESVNEGRKTFHLTDPAIHCDYDLMRFTSTNLGQRGTELFFRSHKCNSICKRLGLTEVDLEAADTYSSEGSSDSCVDGDW